LKYQRGMVEPG